MPTDVNPAPNPTLRMEAMSARLAENWWAIVIRGVLALLFGLMTFALPGAALATFIILFSAYMLVDGVFGIVAGIRAAQRHERWGLLILEGAVDIVVGVLAFLWPISAIFAFVVMLAAWALVSGGLMIGAAFRLHLSHGRWLLGLAGFISILFGIALAAAPGAAALALTLWFGAYAVVFGIALIVLGIRLRNRRTVVPYGGGAGI